MGYSTLTQIGLIIISVVIVFTYIKPTFAEIGTAQEELFEYNNAVVKAEEFNTRLRELLATENSLSASDRAALDTFMPIEIDEVQLMRDLENIAEQEGIVLDSIAAASQDDNNKRDLSSSRMVTDDPESGVQSPHVALDYSVSLTSTYETLKLFLARLEANAYVIEINGLEFGTARNENNDEQSDGQVSVNQSGEVEYAFKLDLRVYKLNTAEPNSQFDDEFSVDDPAFI